MFNPRPAIEVIRVDDAHSIYVIDDALVEPEKLVALACKHWSAAENAAHNAYPGPELHMPRAIDMKLDEFFMSTVRKALGARRIMRSYSRLAMVTMQPNELAPRQWIAHRDRMDVAPGQCIGASVLYLFRDAALGGTSFFAPKRPHAEIDRLVHESGTDDRAGFQQKFGVEPGYQTETNYWFEKLLTIEPRWNRMVFYDGALFHCADIRAPERLTNDPSTGRLTFNGFFTCSKALQ